MSLSPSVTCWEMESYDEHHMEASFMKKSLVLRLMFGSIIPDATENSTISKRTVTDLSLKSTLPGDFVYKMVYLACPQKNKKSRLIIFFFINLILF